MNITINFDNYNGGIEEGIRVYRDVAPIADGALPAPLATLPPGSTQYVDATAVRGTKYYYRFGVFSGADELVSPNKAIMAVAPNDTGPGPQSLIAGDWDLGYFGYTKGADLMTYGTLSGLLGVTDGTATLELGWSKVAYKGKVLYIARGAARYQLTYQSLYLAGAVYGTNDNGANVPSGQTPTNQYRPQTVGNYTVIPRLLKGMPDGAAVPAANKADKDATQLASHEYDDIISTLVNAARSTTDTSYSTFSRNDEMHFTSLTQSSLDLTQQPAGWAALTGLCRGMRSGTSQPVRVATVTMFDTNLALKTVNYAGIGNVNTVTNWRPVLELVM